MKKSALQQYSKIKREYETFKELKENLGLPSYNYTNIKEIRRKLTQTANLVKKNERERRSPT